MGQGTTIALWLPQADATAPPIGAVKAAPVDVIAPRSRSILVVDDDALVAMGTVAMLEDLGHDVHEASSGRMALEVLAANPAIDLVITDHAMPGMTGAELARNLRTTHPTLPVVLATGYAELPGGDELRLPRLSKPFRQDDLVNLLHRLEAPDQPLVKAASLIAPGSS